jgi:hypothetical protein
MSDFILTRFGFSDVSNWTLLLVGAAGAAVALLVLLGFARYVGRRYGDASDE